MENCFAFCWAGLRSEFYSSYGVIRSWFPLSAHKFSYSDLVSVCCCFSVRSSKGAGGSCLGNWVSLRRHLLKLGSVSCLSFRLLPVTFSREWLLFYLGPAPGHESGFLRQSPVRWVRFGISLGRMSVCSSQIWSHVLSLLCSLCAWLQLGLRCSISVALADFISWACWPLGPGSRSSIH
jgi:hypothetical protein